MALLSLLAHVCGLLPIRMLKMYSFLYLPKTDTVQKQKHKNKIWKLGSAKFGRNRFLWYQSMVYIGHANAYFVLYMPDI